MIDKRQQFEKFLEMMIEGRNDLTYRSYVIEDTSYVKRPYAYGLAELTPPRANDAECSMAALKLQRDLLTDGHPVIPLDKLNDWVLQFWNYYRIKNHYRKGKKRHPEVSTRMFADNMEIESELAAKRDADDDG